MDVYIFKYHEVTDKPNKSGFTNKGAYPYKHSKRQFKDDLETIISKFHKSTTVNKIKQGKKENLILTFDDGGNSAMYIAEELEKLNCRGHFFIVTSLINKNNFLTAKQIKELSTRGHVIGTHSHTHPTLFRDLSMRKKVFEWSKSKTILEEILGQKITIASLPGGDLNDATIQSAARSGIKHLFTSEPGLKIWVKFGVNCYPAFCPKNKTSKKLIIKWTNGEGLLELKLIRQIKNFIKIALKPIYKLNLFIFSTTTNKL